MKTDDDRITALDSLRGLAVLLMLEQHLGFWLWDFGGRDGFLHQSLGEFTFMVAFNGLGGLAAPLFIMLAGIGASMFRSKEGYQAVIVFKRGIVLIVFGYLLNFIALDWFTAGSWYVLHLIGFALMVSPILMRLPSGLLIGLAASVLLCTVPLQEFLGTPPLSDDSYMTDYHRSWGILKLALAEGHFPVFPWISLFMIGIPMGRWILSKKFSPMLILSAVSLAAAVILTAFSFLAPHISRGHLMERMFIASPTFYPAMPPIMLALCSVSAGMIALFVKMETLYKSTAQGWLAPLGRISLTILLVHIMFLSSLSHPWGFWKYFNAPVTLAITAAVLVSAVFIARLWSREGYRYGAEWLLRRISG